MNLRSNHAPSSSANVPRPICTPLRLQIYLIVVHLLADIVRLTPSIDETLVEKDCLCFDLCKVLFLRISILRFLSVSVFFPCSESDSTDI